MEWIGAFWGWWTTDRVSAAANVGLLVLAIITAWAAVRALRQSKEAIEQNEEIQTRHSRDSLASQQQQERSQRMIQAATERAYRPVMLAQYLPPEDVNADLELEIRNIGKTIAHNVRVEFYPPLPEPDLKKLNENTPSNITYNEPVLDYPKKVFVNKTFSSWVPGQSVTVPFWAKHKDYEPADWSAPSAEGIWPGQMVKIQYQDETRKSYTDFYTLNASIWAGRMFQDSDEKKQRQAMEKIQKDVSSFVGKWGTLPKTFSNFFDYAKTLLKNQ